MPKQIHSTPRKAWTTLALLNWTITYFESHGIEQPRAGAEILVAHALGMERIGLYLHYDRPVEPKELETLKGFIRRRLQREPVAYIVGEKGFWSLDLHVNLDVLIPRPETEMLVEAALKLIPLKTGPRPLSVLELGTGSGAVIIALAVERPGHRFAAVDISPGALSVASANAKRHGVEDRIDFLQGKWFEPVRHQGGCFDLVVSNPPYVARSAFETLAPEIVQYEPREALDGGADGLDAIGLIVAQGPAHICRGGWLLMEIGSDQGSRVESLVRGAGVYDEFSIVKDFTGLDRVMRARIAAAQRFDTSGSTW
jgi:release factor glutamine methyltransferase